MLTAARRATVLVAWHNMGRSVTLALLAPSSGFATRPGRRPADAAWGLPEGRALPARPLCRRRSVSTERRFAGVPSSTCTPCGAGCASEPALPVDTLLSLSLGRLSGLADGRAATTSINRPDGTARSALNDPRLAFLQAQSPPAAVPRRPTRATNCGRSSPRSIRPLAFRCTTRARAHHRWDAAVASCPRNIGQQRRHWSERVHWFSGSHLAHSAAIASSPLPPTISPASASPDRSGSSRASLRAGVGGLDREFCNRARR